MKEWIAATENGLKNTQKKRYLGAKSLKKVHRKIFLIFSKKLSKKY